MEFVEIFGEGEGEWMGDGGVAADDDARARYNLLGRKWSRVVGSPSKQAKTATDR